MLHADDVYVQKEIRLVAKRALGSTKLLTNEEAAFLVAFKALSGANHAAMICTDRKDFEYYIERVQRKSSNGKKCVNIRGRLTWDCTPEVEKNNVYTIVISKSMKDSGQPQDPQIYKVCASVQEAIDYCSSPPFCDEIGPVWIMGGAEIYKEAINHPQCRYIFLTHIYKTFEADTFFPMFEDQFEEISLDDVDGSMQQENGLTFQFKVYKKKSEVKL